MEDNSNILEMKFSGGGMNPYAVRASEVAELINNFEKILVSTLHEKNPDIDIQNYAYLSFSQIKNESLGLRFWLDRAKEAFISAYLLITTSIANNEFNDLPYPAIENLKAISRFSKKHNCDCEYIYDNKSLAKFTPATTIEISAKNVIKGETVIYGKIERVGGVEPRIVFKDHTDNKVYFEVSEKIAKELATKLYEDIALTGIATWDKKSYKVIDFKVTDITDLNNQSLTKTFLQLSEITSNHWVDFEDSEILIN